MQKCTENEETIKNVQKCDGFSNCRHHRSQRVYCITFLMYKNVAVIYRDKKNGRAIVREGDHLSALR